MAEFQIKKEVTWGHIMTVIPLVLAGFMAWTDLKERIVKVETRQDATELRQDRQEIRAKEDSAKINEKLDRLDNKLDRLISRELDKN